MMNLFITLLVSQGLFAKTYGGTDNDVALSVTQTTDGGCAVAGLTSSFGAGSYDFLILKLASDGSLTWARTFGGTDDDLAWSITQTADGGLAVAGGTTSFGAGSYDFLVLKLASDGSLTWARTFGGTSYDYAWSITQTADGGYALAGHTYSFGAGSWDFLILKLDSAGNLAWARTFGGTDDDYGRSIAQTTDGGCIVVGFTYGFGVGNNDCLIFKLDSAGNLAWARTFGGANYDEPWSATQTADGGYAVAGYTWSFGAGNSDFLVLKLDSAGNLAWARTFGGANYDEARSLTKTADGGYALAGYTYSFGAGYSDLLALKLDSAGNLAWARTFGGTDDEDDGRSIAQTTDGGYAVTGGTGPGEKVPDRNGYGAGGSDFLILKIDSVGNYPDCVDTCSPTTTTPPVSTSSPTGLLPCAPSTSSPTPVVTTPSLTMIDACPPVKVREVNILPGSGIACFFVPGGVSFNSPGALPISIYAVDGKLAYAGELREGENRIGLETGVYLWEAGQYKGKAVVR